mmetsp:Transcript_17511/g.53606  ORF Transcript_17511/g.53606 Transcript_17511/m.53606 type:complete len:322 (-) Transcript_17511:253-1218(-)
MLRVTATAPPARSVVLEIPPVLLEELRSPAIQNRFFDLGALAFAEPLPRAVHLDDVRVQGRLVITALPQRPNPALRVAAEEGGEVIDVEEIPNLLGDLALRVQDANLRARVLREEALQEHPEVLEEARRVADHHDVLHVLVVVGEGLGDVAEVREDVVVQEVGAGTREVEQHGDPADAPARCAAQLGQQVVALRLQVRQEVLEQITLVNAELGLQRGHLYAPDAVDEDRLPQLIKLVEAARPEPAAPRHLPVRHRRVLEHLVDAVLHPPLEVAVDDLAAFFCVPVFALEVVEEVAIEAVADEHALELPRLVLRREVVMQGL